jgi:hypothetical protein
MKVKCVDNRDVEHNLTLYKIYEVNTAYNDLYLVVKNDCGSSLYYFSDRFMEIEDTHES